MEQVQDIDAIVVPTGGGGLLAGVAVAVKNLHPDIKIIVSYFVAMWSQLKCLIVGCRV
jgi:threonine dehydratase